MFWKQNFTEELQYFLLPWNVNIEKEDNFIPVLDILTNQVASNLDSKAISF